jgi:gamma-glutamyltranspeptidase/glutathione hydrolase/leukotriene-C4 hydrolase
VVKYENWTMVTGDHFLLDAAMRAVLLKKGHVLKPLAGGTISPLVGSWCTIWRAAEARPP